MATSLNCSFSTVIRASSDPRKRDGVRKPASPTWWAPIFGWSSDPDYVSGSNVTSASEKKPVLESETGRPRSKFPLGCFTEEKAKQLRRKTTESASFHDLMYHSAIASRLASDVSDSVPK